MLRERRWTPECHCDIPAQVVITPTRGYQSRWLEVTTARVFSRLQKSALPTSIVPSADGAYPDRVLGTYPRNILPQPRQVPLPLRVLVRKPGMF